MCGRGWALLLCVLAQEVLVVAPMWALRYRLYAGQDVLHVHTSLGPFPAPEASSYDGFLRLDTNVSSGGVWWTDSNGCALPHSAPAP